MEQIHSILGSVLRFVTGALHHHQWTTLYSLTRGGGGFWRGGLTGKSREWKLFAALKVQESSYMSSLLIVADNDDDGDGYDAGDDGDANDDDDDDDDYADDDDDYDDDDDESWQKGVSITRYHHLGQGKGVADT